MGLGLLAAAASPMGTEAYLEIDGIVRVQGGSTEGARLIVLHNGTSASLVTHGIERFTMTLQLQTIYLLSFEHDACVTKQLYFDTRVPDEFLDKGPFRFPFQVTLEAIPQHERFTYAGPVGHIHFAVEAGDFTYDTDHTRKMDPGLARRMEELRSSLGAPGMPPASIGTGPASGVDPTSGKAIAESLRRFQRQRDHKGRRVLEFDVSPPVVEHVVEQVVEQVEQEQRSLEVLPPMVVSEPDPVIPVPDVPAVPSTPPVVVDREVAPPAPVVKPVAAKPKARIVKPMRSEMVLEVAPDPVPPPALAPDGRSEEVITERLYEITIVRITRNGHTTEFRQVEHHYGAVYYFKDGISCSKLTYEQGTAAP